MDVCTFSKKLTFILLFLKSDWSDLFHTPGLLHEISWVDQDPEGNSENNVKAEKCELHQSIKNAHICVQLTSMGYAQVGT